MVIIVFISVRKKTNLHKNQPAVPFNVIPIKLYSIPEKVVSVVWTLNI